MASEAANRAVKRMLPIIFGEKFQEASELQKIIDEEYAPAIHALRQYAGIMKGNRQTGKWEPMIGFQQLAKDTLEKLGVSLKDKEK